MNLEKRYPNIEKRDICGAFSIISINSLKGFQAGVAFGLNGKTVLMSIFMI